MNFGNIVIEVFFKKTIDVRKRLRYNCIIEINYFVLFEVLWGLIPDRLDSYGI